MKHASKHVLAVAIMGTILAVAFGATAVYAAYTGNDTARHKASGSITNAQCIACHGATATAGSLDPTVLTAHRIHLDSPLMSFDAMGDGCATCHEATDIDQGSGAGVNRQVDAEVCANCHGAFPGAAHRFVPLLPGCEGRQCHVGGCVECHGAGSPADPGPKHAAVGYVDVQAASAPSACPKCHGGLALYQVEDRDPVRLITATAGGHGSMTPSGTRAVDVGDDVTYVITPDSGYHVADVVVDGISVGAVGSHAFSNVTGDHTISATFAITPIATRLTITANRTWVTRGRPVVLSGTITPTQAAGTAVTLYVKKPGSRTWVRLSTRRMTDGRKWSYTYSPSSRGTYYFQTRFTGGMPFLPSTSATRKLSVR